MNALQRKRKPERNQNRHCTRRPSAVAQSFVGECMINQCVIPKVTHCGGSVMIRRCFAGDRFDEVVRNDGILDLKIYVLQRSITPCFFMYRIVYYVPRHTMRVIA